MYIYDLKYIYIYTLLMNGKKKKLFCFIYALFRKCAIFLEWKETYS